MRRRQAIATFAARRIIRLYPSVIIASALYLALGLRPTVELGLSDIFAYFIWPSPYTYVKLIVFYYLGLWAIDRLSSGTLIASILCAAAIYIGYYPVALDTLNSTGRLVLGKLPIEQYIAFFWVATASGAAVARFKRKSYFEWSRVAWLVVLLCCYFGLKLLFIVGGIAVWAYPVLMILVLMLSWLAFSTLGGTELVAALARLPLIGPFIGLSGALSLQIYVVHEPLALSKALSSLVFPLNIVVLCAIALVGAAVLRLLVDVIVAWMGSRMSVLRET